MVDQIAAQIEGSAAIFAIDYRGISVPEAAALRGSLREADASFRVVKNRLTKLAAEKAGREELGELLEGPTALAFIRGDTAMAAKAISTFNREHDVLAFKGGFMDGLTLDEETFASIARLPSRDVLNGQLAGVVASPLTGLVRGLGSMVSGLAVALQQIAEQGLVSGEPPAARDAAAGLAGPKPLRTRTPSPLPRARTPRLRVSAEVPAEDPDGSATAGSLIRGWRGGGRLARSRRGRGVRPRRQDPRPRRPSPRQKRTRRRTRSETSEQTEASNEEE